MMESRRSEHRDGTLAGALRTGAPSLSVARELLEPQPFNLQGHAIPVRGHDPLYFFSSLLQRTGDLEKQSSVTRDIRSVDLQSRRAGAPTLGQPWPQPRTDLGRQVAEEVSARPVHPYFRRFLIGGIGNQVKQVAGYESIQMAIPIGEGDAMNRSSEVRWPAVRKGRTIPAHSGFNVRVTVHRPWFIR